MVSDNESECTDSKTILNQLEPVGTILIEGENFQAEFSDHFSKCPIFNIFFTLKNKKW